MLSGAAHQTPAAQQPVFRGAANLVLVDAYPQKDGQIVEGLTAADFDILEDGKPQKVESFEFVRVDASPSENLRRDPNNVREMYQLTADPHNRVFVAYLDTLQTTVEGSHAIRAPLIDLLNRVVGPDDLFGVMAPGMRPTDLTQRPKGIKVIGGTAASTAAQMAAACQLVEQGSLKPVVDSVFEFAEVPAAHARVDTGHKRGSVVVRIAP